MYDKTKPYNDLPLLPPDVDLEHKDLLKESISANKTLAELKGVAQTIPNQTILINTLPLQEARLSSEIENVLTTNDLLYEAIVSNKSNYDPQTKEVLRYREALWDGFNELKKKGQLSTNLFIKLYQKIKENNAGVRDTSGTKIINSKRETIYTPPDGEKIIREKLKNLEEYIHNKEDQTDPLIKLAVIHYQFEAIHPFADGNGRTGRIINILYIIRQKLLDLPVIYLSRYVIENKNEYYKHLRNVTEKYAWIPWISYMLKGVKETAGDTIKKIIGIKDLFDKTVDEMKKKLSSRVYSKEFIELLFTQPYCKVEFVVKAGIAKRQTAADYLKEVEKTGLLKSKKVGKEVLYLNVKLFDLLSK